MAMITNKELQMFNNKAIRNQLVMRKDIFTKVKPLILLDNSEFATRKQVAEYYGLTKDDIKNITKQNQEELLEDGYMVLSGANLRGFKNLTGYNKTAKILSVYPIKAILKIGLFARNSITAETIRNELIESVN